MSDFSRELASHIDRVRRRTTPARPGLITRELTRGWLSARPDAPPGEFPSASMNRVYWLTQQEPLSGEQLAEAAEEFQNLGCTRAYIWLAPWAWNPSVETALNKSGAERWPWVEYIALSRPASEPVAHPDCQFAVRRMDPDEAAEIFQSIRSWYSEDGAAAAAAMIRAGAEEGYAAFDGTKPVAVGLLALDGQWGYLGAAGTDPEYRRRGAQQALIAARIERVRASGGSWCTVETNTTVAVSLRNLERGSFKRAINWRVYGWNVKAP